MIMRGEKEETHSNENVSNQRPETGQFCQESAVFCAAKCHPAHANVHH